MKYEIYNILDEFGFEWIYNTPESEIDIKKFEEIRNWDKSKWLVLSSLIFSIPAIWILTTHLFTVPNDKEIFKMHTDFPVTHSEEHSKSLYFISTIVIIAALISINYWINAKKGWRRNVDLFFAKIVTIALIYYWLKYMNVEHYLIILFIFPLLYLFYKNATINIFGYNPIWVKYHFGVHIIITVLTLLLLYEIYQQTI